MLDFGFVVFFFFNDGAPPEFSPLPLHAALPLWFAGGALPACKPAGKCLRLEFSVAPQASGGPLASTGLLIVNPPWTLAGELKTILPELEKPLGQGGAGRFRLETPKP